MKKIIIFIYLNKMKFLEILNYILKISIFILKRRTNVGVWVWKIIIKMGLGLMVELAANSIWGWGWGDSSW